ncbi:MAG TPA: hypothetical protein VMS64_10660 [Candidatus Methylomirabilis sp.]|nr:hypothetical protein [Candidatus Methylomirabilis sp.]
MIAITTDKKMGDPLVGLAVTPVEAGEVRPVAHTDRYEFREIREVKPAVLQGVLRPLSATPVGATTVGRHTEAQ